MVLRTMLEIWHAPEERVTGMLVLSTAHNVNPLHPYLTEALRV
jgi:hypothetical protein